MENTLAYGGEFSSKEYDINPKDDYQTMQNLMSNENLESIQSISNQSNRMSSIKESKQSVREDNTHEDKAADEAQ